jgi:hypothetical protein
MKKVIIGKPKILRNDNTSQENVTYRDQVASINQIFLGNELDKHKKIKSDLRKKLTSYKAQDIKKDRYEATTLITEDQLYEKLVASRLKCYYCSKEVQIIYKFVRDDYQWTLDRIDNDLGHSSVNTVISCLKCNLQRRVTDCKKFDFTKKLRIKKENDL